MSVQCRSIGAVARVGDNRPSRLQVFLKAAQLQMQIWSYQRRLAHSRRILESLPDHIRSDLGWPNIDDRLAGIPGQQSRRTGRN